MYQYRSFILLPIILCALFAMASWSENPATNQHLADIEQPAVFTDRTDISMRMVPGGCFETRSQILAHDYGKPRRLICVNQFAIGQFEVTQKLWQTVMGNNPAFFSACGPDCPVERVSWNDVQTFIERLNRMTSGNFRLPTEYEWEYACRSDADYHLYCGGSLATNISWFADNSGGKTHPVGQLQANSLENFDMSGNVWEWVQDRYNETYSDMALKAQADFWNHAYRVLRGGSWRFNAGSLQAANRGYRTNPNDRTYDIGFRLARTRQVARKMGSVVSANTGLRLH